MALRPSRKPILYKKDDAVMASANETQKPSKGLTYKDAGVDIDAGNELVNVIKPLIKSTNRAGVMGAIGGFGGLFDLKATDYQDPVLVAANDGVGTKLKLAIETDHHDTVGIDLVAMCVNDLIVQGAEPLFFLDYFATGQLKTGVAEAVISGIAEGCRQAGCALIGGETAEMPGMYDEGDYDLAGFAVGAVERAELRPKSTLEPGDRVIALGSNGVHSNGYSLVRKVIELSGLHLQDSAPFAPEQTLSAALLTPTRIYVKPVLNALKSGVDIKALAHITGGGLIENIPRVLKNGLGVEIDLSTIAPPPVFSWLAGVGGIAASEMIRTFNCGTGMALIIPESQARATIDQFIQWGETAHDIGRVIKSDEPFTTINQLEFKSL